MRIFLVGFMCSGKSTVGELLSHLLNYPFFDVDQEVVKKEGMSIPQIFQKKGEEYFRNLEFETLKELSLKEKAIISTGGGLGANPKAMDFMKSKGKVVFLDIDFETFLDRCGNSEERPLLARPVQELKKLFYERKKIYERADIKIKGEKKPEEIAREILQFLKGTPFVGEEGTA